MSNVMDGITVGPSEAAHFLPWACCFGDLHVLCTYVHVYIHVAVGQKR